MTKKDYLKYSKEVKEEFNELSTKLVSIFYCDKLWDTDYHLKYAEWCDEFKFLHSESNKLYGHYDLLKNDIQERTAMLRNLSEHIITEIFVPKDKTKPWRVYPWEKQLKLNRERTELLMFLSGLSISTLTQHNFASNQTKIKIVPIFKNESINDVFGFLRDYFNQEDQQLLYQLMHSGNTLERPIIFLGNGNQLADVFKKLFEHGYITGCQKKDLQKWIANNFNFTNGTKATSFTMDYLEKCISRNYYPCKKPLFEIENGIISKTKKAHRKR